MRRAAASPPREMRLLLVVGETHHRTLLDQLRFSLSSSSSPLSAVVYLMLCSVMLLLQTQTTIEPLHPSSLSGYRARLLREAEPGGGGGGGGGGGEAGGVRRSLASLLESQMFREQEDKLKWISQRIERYYCAQCIWTFIR